MDYDLYSNNLPVCPHCDAKVDTDNEDDYGWWWEEDGEVFDFECWSCKKEFKIKAHVKYTYTTCPESLADYYED